MRPKDSDLVTVTSISNVVSKFFFLCGFFLGKIQYLPIPLATSIFNGISLLFYTLGYSTWIIGSHYYPEHTHDVNTWYGFAQFKEQYKIAASVGLLATTLSIVGLFFPPFLIASSWTFLISNLIWTTSEYHKLKNPDPSDTEFSYSAQKTYLSYAMGLCAMNAVASLYVTLTFIFPAITLPMFIASAIVVLSLSIYIVERWLNYKFGHHPSTDVMPESHKQISQLLGSQNEPKIEISQEPEPHHNVTILSKRSEPKPFLIPSNDETTPEQHACSMSL